MNKKISEKSTEPFEQAIKRHEGGAVIIMELPVEQYFETNVSSIKALTENGFEGVYVSFQRPFNNISSMLQQQGININKLFFVDVATALTQEKQQEAPRCMHISQQIDIDELVRAIYTSLDKLKGKKKFIFIDSLTTIALYKPLSEVIRFCEFLMRTIKKQELGGQDILILNVAKDLSQKKFIKDIALHVDQTISV